MEMQTEQTKVLEGKNLFGEARKYTFKLIDAEDGTWLLHRFGAVMSDAYETVAPIFKKFFGGEGELSGEDGLKLGEIARVLPQIFDWETIKAISAVLLPDTIVETVEDGKYTANENGFIDLIGDPLDHYLMLLYSLAANFPKYVSFLGIALDSQEDDEGNHQSQ
jgi:hypothetical protein